MKDNLKAIIQWQWVGIRVNYGQLLLWLADRCTGTRRRLLWKSIELRNQLEEEVKKLNARR